MRIALIVDDDSIERELLADILSDDFNIVQAVNGQEAIDFIADKHEDIAIIMLDLVMPVKSGLDVLKFMYDEQLYKKIPVIIISADGDVEGKEECFNLGAYDYLEKPLNRYAVIKRAQNSARVFSHNNQLEYQLKRQAEELKAQNDKLQLMNSKILTMLGAVVEERDFESGEHIIRVKRYTKYLARYLQKNHPELNLTQEQVDMLVEVSALHDIGKISIPDAILLKPGKLTDEEYEIMKTHTTHGAKLIQPMVDAWGYEYQDTANNVVLYHHERWDGKGYPKGLKGDEIPLSAQIVALADVFDALTTDRVYKKAFSVEKSYDMIMHDECGAFSPLMKEALQACILDFEQIHWLTTEMK